jgi:hypothetical protein
MILKARNILPCLILPMNSQDQGNALDRPFQYLPAALTAPVNDCGSKKGAFTRPPLLDCTDLNII